jgi:hypothetical protein
MSLRMKMCKDKVSFTNIAAAKRRAEKFGQRVYECPVCFCYHCTSLEKWQDEFVPIKKYQRAMKEAEQLPELRQRVERYGRAIFEMNGRQARLKKEVKSCRKILLSLREKISVLACEGQDIAIIDDDGDVVERLDLRIARWAVQDLDVLIKRLGDHV